MRVGNSQDFEHALDRSVFADAAVQGIEGDIRPELGENLGDVARHVDSGNAVAARLQGVGAAAAGIERDRPLGGPAAHQNRHMLHCRTTLWPAPPGR